MNAYKKYCLLSFLGVSMASFYPLYMGVNVVADMIKNGTVIGENYPKYIIPYTPISLALITGVLLMPIFIRFAKRFALLAGSSVAVGVFFLSELLLESQVTVTTTGVANLESWQMFMCYVPREYYETHTKTAVDILLGEYNPAFKLHFYLISVLLILALLNCFYGFAEMLRFGDQKRRKILILQSVTSGVFLGLCILACFTAFFRNGELAVSTISAFLMSIFFLVFGITAGIYVGSFSLGKKKILSLWIPAFVSVSTAALMYIGEMILLSKHLYRFGEGFLFEGIEGLILAPIDVLIILLSGGICGFILSLLNKSIIKESETQSVE